MSRLTNQVFTGQPPMAYDKAGRLTRRTYPNGVVQTNAFDTANRITNLEFRSVNSNGIAVALSYAYDRSGNKTASTETGTLNWPMPSLTDETARYTPGGRLINRQISTNSSLQSSISYSYDPSGNMTNASGGGQTWVLAYDEDKQINNPQTTKVQNAPSQSKQSLVSKAWNWAKSFFGGGKKK